MSDDIVARLRQLGKQFHATDEEEEDAGLEPEWHSVQTADETIEDAIAEIERLRAERDALFVLTDRLTADEIERLRAELVSMTEELTRLKAERAKEER